MRTDLEIKDSLLSKNGNDVYHIGLQTESLAIEILKNKFLYQKLSSEQKARLLCGVTDQSELLSCFNEILPYLTSQDIVRVASYQVALVDLIYSLPILTITQRIKISAFHKKIAEQLLQRDDLDLQQIVNIIQHYPDLSEAYFFKIEFRNRLSSRQLAQLAIKNVNIANQITAIILDDKKEEQKRLFQSEMDVSILMSSLVSYLYNAEQFIKKLPNDLGSKQQYITEVGKHHPHLIETSHLLLLHASHLSQLVVHVNIAMNVLMDPRFETLLNQNSELLFAIAIAHPFAPPFGAIILQNPEWADKFSPQQLQSLGQAHPKLAEIIIDSNLCDKLNSEQLGWISLHFDRLQRKILSKGKKIVYFLYGQEIFFEALNSIAQDSKNSTERQPHYSEEDIRTIILKAAYNFSDLANALYSRDNTLYRLQSFLSRKDHALIVRNNLFLAKQFLKEGKFFPIEDVKEAFIPTEIVSILSRHQILLDTEEAKLWIKEISEPDIIFALCLNIESLAYKILFEINYSHLKKLNLDQIVSILFKYRSCIFNFLCGDLSTPFQQYNTRVEFLKHLTDEQRLKILNSHVEIKLIIKNNSALSSIFNLNEDKEIEIGEDKTQLTLPKTITHWRSTRFSQSVLIEKFPHETFSGLCAGFALEAGRYHQKHRKAMGPKLDRITFRSVGELKQRNIAERISYFQYHQLIFKKFGHRGSLSLTPVCIKEFLQVINRLRRNTFQQISTDRHVVSVNICSDSEKLFTIDANDGEYPFHCDLDEEDYYSKLLNLLRWGNRDPNFSSLTIYEPQNLRVPKSLQKPKPCSRPAAQNISYSQLKLAEQEILKYFSHGDFFLAIPKIEDLQQSAKEHSNEWNYWEKMKDFARRSFRLWDRVAWGRRFFSLIVKGDFRRADALIKYDTKISESLIVIIEPPYLLCVVDFFLKDKFILSENNKRAIAKFLQSNPDQFSKLILPKLVIDNVDFFKFLLLQIENISDDKIKEETIKIFFSCEMKIDLGKFDNNDIVNLYNKLKTYSLAKSSFYHQFFIYSLTSLTLRAIFEKFVVTTLFDLYFGINKKEEFISFLNNIIGIFANSATQQSELLLCVFRYFNANDFEEKNALPHEIFSELLMDSIRFCFSLLDKADHKVKLIHFVMIRLPLCQNLFSPRSKGSFNNDEILDFLILHADKFETLKNNPSFLAILDKKVTEHDTLSFSSTYHLLNQYTFYQEIHSFLGNSRQQKMKLTTSKLREYLKSFSTCEKLYAISILFHLVAHNVFPGLFQYGLYRRKNPDSYFQFWKSRRRDRLIFTQTQLDHLHLLKNEFIKLVQENSDNKQVREIASSGNITTFKIDHYNDTREWPWQISAIHPSVTKSERPSQSFLRY